jgi:elongation factor P
MVIATDLREGMVIRYEGQVYKVLEVEAKAGAAKMGGVVKAKLANVHGGHLIEPHLRPQEKLEDLNVERHTMEFLYAAGGACTFMRPDTYEQVEVPDEVLGPGQRFLQPGMALPVEFFEGEPISVVFPDIVEARVETTAPPVHAQQDSAWKEATLENGLAIHVPLFIAPGETVRVEVRTGRYVERARTEKKRGA